MVKFKKKREIGYFPAISLFTFLGLRPYNGNSTVIAIAPTCSRILVLPLTFRTVSLMCDSFLARSALNRLGLLYF
jgi:hypothetical protein